MLCSIRLHGHSCTRGKDYLRVCDGVMSIRYAAWSQQSQQCKHNSQQLISPKGHNSNAQFQPPCEPHLATLAVPQVGALSHHLVSDPAVEPSLYRVNDEVEVALDVHLVEGGKVTPYQ